VAVRLRRAPTSKPGHPVSSPRLLGPRSSESPPLFESALTLRVGAALAHLSFMLGDRRAFFLREGRTELLGRLFFLGGRGAVGNVSLLGVGLLGLSRRFARPVFAWSHGWRLPGQRPFETLAGVDALRRGLDDLSKLAQTGCEQARNLHLADPHALSDLRLAEAVHKAQAKDGLLSLG
jgi:hypothetical protein